MIAPLTADALQISDMDCRIARHTQRTIACSHLIEYATEGARYAGSNASGRSARLCSERGRSERVGVRVSTLWSVAVLMRADGVP
jgi:hypothetical protein